MAVGETRAPGAPRGGTPRGGPAGGAPPGGRLLRSRAAAVVDTPFRAEVNGRACVVHAGAGGLRIEHGAGCREVPYSAVRCAQRRRRRLTVNAEIGGRLVLYSVEARGARRLYELLLAGCSGSP